MNDQHPLDDVLRAWTDMGDEHLPAQYLAAALDEIDTTNQRGARWAPLEDFLMRLQPFAAPLAIAAILVAAIGAAAIVTRPSVVGPASPSPAPSVTAADPSAAGPSPTVELTPSPVGTQPDASEPTSGRWQVPLATSFSWLIPADWSRTLESSHGTSTARTAWINPTTGRAIAVTTSGPDSVDAWLEQITTTPRLSTTEVRQTTVGDAAGVTLDVVGLPLEGEEECASFGECYILFGDESGYWPVKEGRPSRIWIVDVQDEIVLVVTDAPEAAFDGWIGEVENALATVEWDR